MSSESSASHRNEYCRLESELLSQDVNNPISSWRILRIMSEFVMGFDMLQKIGLAASIFGSARTPEGDEQYQKAERLGGLLARSGFTVITGGGQGIMEAANKGAYEAGGISLGLNINLPHEQRLNRYITDSATFHYFFTRKVSLVFSSEVYIYFPGGFGTLDEFFEIVTLVQTKKIGSLPVVLVGRNYWAPLVDWMRTTLLETHHTIDEDDLALFHVVDSAEEAHELVVRLVPGARAL